MSSKTTLHHRSYLEIISRLSYACGKQREWDSKKAPTKKMSPLQAGNFLKGFVYFIKFFYFFILHYYFYKIFT